MVQVKRQCESEKLRLLRETLEAVQHEEIAYDKQYVMSAMGWDSEVQGSSTTPG